jgi:hypothetical protein
VNPLPAKVEGVDCDLPTLQAAIAEAEADFAVLDLRKELSGDWWPNPDCLIPIGSDDAEE